MTPLQVLIRFTAFVFPIFFAGGGFLPVLLDVRPKFALNFIGISWVLAYLDLWITVAFLTCVALRRATTGWLLVAGVVGGFALAMTYVLFPLYKWIGEALVLRRGFRPCSSKSK